MYQFLLSVPHGLVLGAAGVVIVAFSRTNAAVRAVQSRFQSRPARADTPRAPAPAPPPPALLPYAAELCYGDSCVVTEYTASEPSIVLRSEAGSGVDLERGCTVIARSRRASGLLWESATIAVFTILVTLINCLSRLVRKSGK